jgi:hypothetical protein
VQIANHERLYGQCRSAWAIAVVDVDVVVVVDVDVDVFETRGSRPGTWVTNQTGDMGDT